MRIESCLGLSSSVALLAGLGACASLPEVTRTYYFPEAQQDIAVVQTLGCSFATKDADVYADGATPGKNKPPKKQNAAPKPLYSTGPYSTAIATITTTYIANYDKPYTLDYSAFDGLFGDADIAVGLTDDGRLSSINAAGTGEGAAIIKAAVTVASVATLAKPFIEKQKNQPTPPPTSPECQLIKDHGAINDKANSIYTLTLNYKLRVGYKFGKENWDAAPPKNAPHQANTVTNEIFATDPDGTSNGHLWGDPIRIRPNSGANPISDADVYTLGPGSLFQFIATRQQYPNSSKKDPISQPGWNDDHSTASLEVPSIANVEIQVIGPTADLKTDAATFYHDYVLAPTTSALPIPVPKAPVFGKIATSAQFGQSGIVEKLEYNKASAMSDLITSGAQIYNQVHTPPETTAQQAAGIEAQADLIYEQQRLVGCQLSPKSCQSK